MMHAYAVFILLVHNLPSFPSLMQVKLNKSVPGVDHILDTFHKPEEPVPELQPDEPEFILNKRAVFNRTINWDYKVPYVIDPSFSSLGPNNMTLLKRAIKYITDNVCLTFVDETSRWNSSDPQWFTKNGYFSNDYIFVVDKPGDCSVSGGGELNGNRQVVVSPCYEFWIMVHEWLHTIGVAHMQQGYLREYYITINFDDIQEAHLDSYKLLPKANDFYNSYFDPSSATMYSDSTWTRNSNKAYTPIRDDLFNTITKKSGNQVNFLELNEVFKCAERFCGRNNVDCAPGYYSYVKGVCRCVCPDEYDVATNCKTLKNGPSSITKWPNTPVLVLAGGPSHTCPTGFNQTPGWFSFPATWALEQLPPAPVQFPVSGTTTYFPICTKNVSAGATVDWETWPPGGYYCMIKPVDVSCGAGFTESGASLQTTSNISYNGSIGDITIVSQNLTIKTCCRYQEFPEITIDLPDGAPFRLLSRGTCPSIKGLKTYSTKLTWWTYTKSLFESVASTSPFWFYSNSLVSYSCYFQPGVYGCNELITLDANKRSVTIQTPTLTTGIREPYRRCFYVFNAPKNSQILITFNQYSLSPSNDDFLVKKYHPWQVAYKINNTNYPAQILSESNYFSAESFIGFEQTKDLYGVNFTAKVILPEDYCYDPTTNGADYRGKTAISETYEPCIEWSKAVNCSNFPKSDQMANILSGNQCRNPDDRRGPWCYTYINGTNCNIRYCDACNFKRPIDSIKNCSSLISANPNFCSSSLQKFGCFVSCNFTVQPTDRAACGPPNIPSDGKLLQPMRSSYKEGEKVQVMCALNNDTGLPVDLYCTATGWTPLAKACTSLCEDKVDTCERVMTKTPNFCVNTKTADSAKSFCSLSCGFCSDLVTNCSTPSSVTYSRTSALATIKPGQVMTFTCNAGQYYVSGDLSRACSISGNLLGTEPVCQSKPVATDMNLNSVKRRWESLPVKTVVILDKDGYRIPFNGTLSTWYYFCQSSGTVYFIVYRKIGTSYSLVGYNAVNCQADFQWSETIAAANQISVLKDDIVGVFTTDVNTISANNCKDSKEKLMNLPIATNVDAVTKLNSTSFNNVNCYILSLAYRVEPA